MASMAKGLESGDANWTTSGGGMVSKPATARCKVWRAPVSIAVSVRSHVGSDTYSRPRRITTSTPQGSRPCKRWRNADEAARDPLILVGNDEVCSLINEAPSKTGPPLRNAKKSGTRALAGSTTVAFGALSGGNARRAHRAPDSPRARLQAPRTPAADDSPAAHHGLRSPDQCSTPFSTVPFANPRAQPWPPPTWQFHFKSKRSNLPPVANTSGGFVPSVNASAPQIQFEPLFHSFRQFLLRPPFQVINHNAGIKRI